MQIEGCSGTRALSFDEGTLRCSVRADSELWSWAEQYTPCVVIGGRQVAFASAGEIRHEMVRNGTGSGIRSSYRGFSVEGRPSTLAFETYVWIEECTGDVYFEWIPLAEDGTVERVLWPGPMEFAANRSDWYTLIPRGQGLLIPNDWPESFTPMHFNGMFLTADCYMPWFSQIREGAGYLAIALTPWNGCLQVEHPAGGPYTQAAVLWEPSLGRMEYRRMLRYSFREHCDYNEMCKLYRQYVFENGLAATLREKQVRLPSVEKLIGAQFVHLGIKTHVHPLSSFFDPQNPEKNDRLIPFAVRRQQMEQLHASGVKKVYLHLDGWAQPGYDNQHPDYLPACEEAGGWQGMRELADAMQALGFGFGIHDQYRDYYRNAPSFSEEYACRLADGTVPGHARWAGGPQTYLCGTQAPYYVKRNFRELQAQGISLDGAYLDVFTCNEGDECANPRHRMTRRACYEYRGKCFEFLTANGILPSSEEVSDWSMRSLVFCHYAPYLFQLMRPECPRPGIGVPLQNLVYHDCVIEPWMMERPSEGEDNMLYALLNGGAPYLVRDGAYPDTDGSFGGCEGVTPEENRARCRIVSELHERVALQEMKRHEFVDGDPTVQRTVFADGTTVTVWLAEGRYEIGTV